MMSKDGELFLGLTLLASLKIGLSVWLKWRRNTKFVRVGQISQLFYYPVKSCRGIALDEALCTNKGLRYNGVTDRHWMIVRPNKKFLSQRHEPKMAQITASCHGDNLHLDAPGKETLILSKHPALDKSKVYTCSVWGEPVEAIDCGDEAADWISDFLKWQSLRVVCYTEDLPDRDCTITEKPWGNAAVPGDSSAFADWGSYLLANEASLEDLNQRLHEPVTIRQFRPNIVVKCAQAFDEDTWEEILIGSRVQMRCLDPCGRCVQTTVDPERGERSESGEPLRTLKQFRCFPKYGSSPIFCINLTPDVCGLVRVGDPVFAIPK